MIVSRFYIKPSAPTPTRPCWVAGRRCLDLVELDREPSRRFNEHVLTFRPGPSGSWGCVVQQRAGPLGWGMELFGGCGWASAPQGGGASARVPGETVRLPVQTAGLRVPLGFPFVM